MVSISLKQYENVGFQTQTTLRFIYKLLQIEVITDPYRIVNVIAL